MIFKKPVQNKKCEYTSDIQSTSETGVRHRERNPRYYSSSDEDDCQDNTSVLLRSPKAIKQGNKQ